jgi:hypothetical protein
MNWKQMRIDKIESRLLVLVGLLGEYENISDCEYDPIEKKKLQDQIQKLNQEINKSCNELEELTKSQHLKGGASSLKALNEDISEPLLEEIRTFEGV